MIHTWNNPDWMELDMSYIFQVSESWRTQPFVDVVVVNSEACPDTHPYEVFYELWPGATMICDCLEREDKLVDKDMICQRGKNGKHKQKECWDQDPMHPVVQSRINGIKVCGQRGGETFETVKRNTDL